MSEQTVTPDTDTILVGMLTENTGRHMLDSGGAYGRHWQQNQGRRFKEEPATTLSFRWGIELTLNVFHWLSERVDYEPEIQAEFEHYAALPNNAEEHWLALMEGFPQWYAEVLNINDKEGYVYRAAGIYGEGEPVTINTYNHESLLSQVLQFTYFEIHSAYGTAESLDQSYVLLQIHNGADVRGGYTAPKVFNCSLEEFSLLDDAKAFLYCEPPAPPQSESLPGIEHRAPERHTWYTDDAYTFYSEGNDYGECSELKDVELFAITSEEEWIKGKLCYLPDGTGLCPVCGGKLSAGAY